MPAPVPALVAGRYAVREVLAHGGMSTVHLAEDVLLERKVALKVFRAAGDPLDADRLRQEGELLARLAHPNLVKAFDAGADEDGGNAWLALELLRGPNLAVALHANGPLPAADVRRLLAQISGALAYIHGLGVVHRDMKPSNVLLTADPTADEHWVAKLADFGIAAELDAERVLAGAAPLGTAAYFSPEQTLGQPVTAASDIYSLGLVVLEALTGERVFPGGAVETATARLFRQPTLPDWLDDGWRALLETMTARDPQKRPSAGQVRAASRSLAAELGTEATARTEYDADMRTEPATLLAPAVLAAAVPLAAAPLAAVPDAPGRRRRPRLRLRPGFADRFSRRALVASSAGVLVLCTAAAGTALVAAAPAAPIIPLEEALPAGPPAVAQIVPPRPTPTPETAATPRAAPVTRLVPVTRDATVTTASTHVAATPVRRVSTKAAPAKTAGPAHASRAAQVRTAKHGAKAEKKAARAASKGAGKTHADGKRAGEGATAHRRGGGKHH